MLADQQDYVVGVDTHRDRHALAVVSAATGALVLEAEVDADRGGYERALSLVRAQAPGSRRWAVEGCGSYGAGLARFLAARGEQVVEVERPQRTSGARARATGSTRCGQRGRRWPRRSSPAPAAAVRGRRCGHS